jgi:pseudouridine synthase
MAEQRLNRYVSLAAAVSRRTADEMIRAGRVTLRGVVVTDPGTIFDDRTQEVRIDGGTVVPIAEEKIYILLNKPDKVVTTMHDKEGRVTVASLVGEISSRVFPVGRLDFHTTGILLLTNDGELAWKLTHPRFGVEKTYVAKVQGVPDRKAITRLRKGILVDGEMTNPADVRIAESRGDKTWVVMTIAEGRYHQVRKMFDAVGHRVMKLRRVAVGPIRLGAEDTGEWRFLTPQEIRDLFAYVEEREREAAKFKLPPGRKYHAHREESATEKRTRSERARAKAAEDREAERVRAVERGELPAAEPEEIDDWPDWLGGPSKGRKEEAAPGYDEAGEAKPARRMGDGAPPRREGATDGAPARGKKTHRDGRHPGSAAGEGARPKGRSTTTAKPKPPKGEGRPTTTPRSKPSKGEGRATTTPRPKPSKGEGRPTTTPRPKPSKGDRDERPHKWSAPQEDRGDRPRKADGEAPPRRDGGREYTPGGPKPSPGGGIHRPKGGFAEKGKGKGHVGSSSKGRGKGGGPSSGPGAGRKGPGGSAPKGKGGARGSSGAPSKGPRKGPGKGAGKGTGKGRGGGR